MNTPDDYLKNGIEEAAEIWIMDCLAHCCELIADERPDLVQYFGKCEHNTNRLGEYFDEDNLGEATGGL